MRRNSVLFSVMVVLVLILSACSTPTATPTEAMAEPTEAMIEPTEAMAEPTALSAADLPTGCLGDAASAIVDLDCREITIAVENAYIPFNYIELATGEPGGWDYEAWTEICTRLHCTPVYVEAAWEGMIQAVADGQFDAAADGITITEDRAEVVDFSIGYINIQQRLLVRTGETRFDSIEAFAETDLIMGTQTNTTNYETATQFLPEERISAFEQFPFAVQALIAGDVDAVILDEVVGMGYMGENASELELIGPAISSDELGFIYPKGSELVDPVNQALQAMMADGFLTNLNVAYFGPDFDITYDDIDTD
ncbi:MAG: ABC transporter substrate-binding protein [Chloroflexi bacterium HGW-Chloroflexi-10]|nr:MAG: ABC transporter substrate-binding protein [Chloroflexi bacterium HGW-Chloroflexi-10]